MLDKAIFKLPGMKRTFPALVLLTIFRALLIVGQALALSRVLTDVWQGNGLNAVVVPAIAFFAAFFLRQVVRNLQDSYLEKYAASRAQELRTNLLDKLFSQGPRLVQKHGTGKVTSLVLEGIDQIETYIGIIVPKVAGVVVVPLILLLTIWSLDWVSGIIVTIIFPFIILYMYLLGYTAKDAAAKRHDEFQLLSNHFTDSMRGIDTLKLFGRSAKHGKKIFEVSERFRGATMKTLRIAILSSAVLDMFATLSLAAVSVMLGFRLIDGSIMLFPALTILMLVPEYFLPVREFAFDYHASLDGKTSLNAVNEILNEPGEKSGAHEIKPWDGKSELTLQDISVTYPDHQALSDVNISVTGPLNVGIVGMSGAGKSTLIETLGGFLTPSSGKFVVAQNGGNTQHMGSLHQVDWQKQALYIPQSPYIFSATLKENIAFYHPETTENQLRNAIDVVGLVPLIEELPHGLDTLIGEGGRVLSGGQAQRIALARAFLDSSRRILLFDEPTAHLDIETEFELKERMLPLMQDRLVFFATHRLHWMQHMDLIIVLEDGAVAEVGTYDELLHSHSAFERLVRHIGGGAPDVA